VVEQGDQTGEQYSSTGQTYVTKVHDNMTGSLLIKHLNFITFDSLSTGPWKSW